MLLNNYQIKLLAAITMLIDHVGVVFFPNIALFRIIGRLSFPLFLLLLVDGEKHTHNVNRYGLRLLLFGLISQPIYHFLFENGQWNILFLLLLGLLCLRGVRVWPKAQILIWIAAGAIAELLNLEYGAYGIALLALIGHFHQNSRWWIGWIGLHLGLLLIEPGFGTFQFPAIFAALPMSISNHKQGRKARWFYLFYPLHLLALWLLQGWLLGL